MKHRILCILALFFSFQISTFSQTWLLSGNPGTTPPTQFLGTTDGQQLLLSTNGIPRVRIGTNAGSVNQGVVAIGNIDPDNTPYGGTLRIKGSDQLTAIDLIKSPSNNGGWDNQIRFYNTNALRHVIADDYTTGKLVFQTNVDNQSGSVDVVDIRGRVQIGTGSISLPSGYNLYVQNGILTEKVKVAISSSSNWADYVFSKNYQLMPLSKVEAYIKLNGHLPGIPSSQQLVNDGGINVADMLSKQMEKIEELTLHIIFLEKRLKKVEAFNKNLKKQVGIKK